MLNASIRENIVFYAPSLFDEARYWDVVQRCCLLPDLDALPDRDFTLVGESGVQLSGGQKSRVCLARAVYCDADVLFLDDVLSAVDAHTGRYIFDHVLAPLCQNGKTVFLVTHQLQYLSRPEIAQIFVLERGEVKRTTWPKLQKKNLKEEASREDDLRR